MQAWKEHTNRTGQLGAKIQTLKQITCSWGAGGVMGLFRQVEDLLAGVWWGDGILTLSGIQRVVLFAIVVGIKELLEPLDEVKIVLESAFDQFLHWDNLN